MDISVFLSSFGLIFVAELGDKTQLTAMALAGKYPWRKVFAGVAAAFVVLNLAAVLVGKVLFLLLPLGMIRGGAGLMFLYFGIMSLREEKGGEEAERAPAHGPFLTSFLIILLAELGD